MLYELRVYVGAPDSVDALHERFATQTLPVFKRAGIDVVGFFTEVNDPRRIVYLTRFADEQSRDAAWAAFAKDPDWLEAKRTSEEKHGRLVLETSSTLLRPTDYSSLQ